MYMYVVNMFVVLDTTHLIVLNVFSGSQPKTDGKHKNEISNIVEMKKHVVKLSNPSTMLFPPVA